MPFVLILVGVFILLSDQPVLMACSLLAYIPVFRAFWKDGEPKTILFGLTFFWLSITIKLFYAVFAAVPYESLSKSSNIIYTSYLTLISFLVFSYGIYITTKKAREKNIIDFNKDFGYSFRRILFVFAGASIAVFILKGFVFFFSGLDQLVYAFIDLKLGLIFLLLYYTFSKKDTIPFVLAILTVEVVLSFFSFFASFKDILFTVLIILAAPKIKPTLKNIVVFSALIILTFSLLLKWQAVKGDYRAFLNKGSKTSQDVEVSQSEALDKLQELAEKKSNLTDDKNLVYESIDRVSYIQFFSEAMLNVPTFIPFENGKLWAANIAHILLPRAFFPDKASIDDSQMVNKYCVRKVATAKMGASFSLGFVAESYIDFGPVLMFPVILLVGCLLGFIYAQILTQSVNYVWGYSMVVGLWTKINCNGTAGSKILGWIITYYVAFFIFKKFLMKPLDNYLRTGKF